MKSIIFMLLISSTSLFAKETKVLETNTMMAGMLVTEILTTTQSTTPMTVRVKVLKDVYNSNKVLVLTKGQMLKGLIKEVDFKTGEATVELETLIANQTITMKVGSADNSAKLKGQVLDFKGKFVLGSYVDSFSQEALDAVGLKKNEVPEAPRGLMNTHSISGLIVELYSGDVSRKGRVYYVPSGVKVAMTSI